MEKLIFITGNKRKVIEVQDILGFSIDILDLDLEELQENDLEKVAINKVKNAYKAIKKPLFIDDVGFYVDAWSGFPGPLIKWILKLSNGNATLLLKMLEKEKNRKATASSIVAYHDGKNIYTFLGSVKGVIATEIRGVEGFGWDAVFVPNGFKKTYDEMTFEEKNEISHRRKALNKFKKFLDSQKK